MALTVNQLRQHRAAVLGAYSAEVLLYSLCIVHNTKLCNAIAPLHYRILYTTGAVNRLIVRTQMLDTIKVSGVPIPAPRQTFYIL